MGIMLHISSLLGHHFGVDEKGLSPRSSPELNSCGSVFNSAAGWSCAPPGAISQDCFSCLFLTAKPVPKPGMGWEALLFCAWRSSGFPFAHCAVRSILVTSCDLGHRTERCDLSSLSSSCFPGRNLPGDSGRISGRK